MHNILGAIFILSVVLVAHTYLFYPFYMLARYSKSAHTFQTYQIESELPAVAILIAAFNEEQVIRKKITSVFNSNYPKEKIFVYVGSDASVDQTDAIVRDLMEIYPNLQLHSFTERSGKISIINQLQSFSNEEILVLTDANVMFNENTLRELINNFKDDQVGLVAANIIKISDKNDGIAFQEKKYLSIENRVKAAESNAFGFIMGAEGGCFAIRNSLFSKVPSKFIVDDFYITLQLILREKKALFNEKAICFEDVPSDVAGEYKRKVRISSGNFQNLFFFRKMLIRFWTALGWSFWSHKVLRWLTPFFLITAALSSGILSFSHSIFCWMFALQVLGFISPLLNYFFKFKGTLLKFISHFYLMNYALFEGFFKFVGGIKSSIWQPVKRDV